MSNQILKLKIRLPNNLIQQIQSVSNERVDKIIQNAISHYVATYAAETVIANSVTQYISTTEEMFEQNFDKLTNLMASLSYVSKFNNNILNAVFINNGGREEDLERLYNEATDTVQKYFHFEDNDHEILPIMKENDELKLKVEALEKQKGTQAGSQSLQMRQPLKPEEVDQEVQKARKQIAKIRKQKEQLEEKKKELVDWINGLILYVVQNYSRIHKNEKLLRDYIAENPKPKV